MLPPQPFGSEWQPGSVEWANEQAEMKKAKKAEDAAAAAAAAAAEAAALETDRKAA
jgi:hypothetical protein